MKRYVIGIEDVARRAKVSVMTVSRAFNKPDAVLPSTRERINAAIREIGYVPNQVAGSLRKQRSNIVAVIIPDIDNSMFSSLLRGISNTLHQAGLTLMLGDSQYSAMNEEETIFSLLRQRPCGLILHSTKHSLRAIRMMEKSGIPIVETGTLTQTPVDMVVSYSNIDGARTVTRHLLDRGYERIGYIGLRSEANERAVERREGFCEVLRDAGIAIDPGYMVETDSGLGAGGAALMQLLRPHPEIQAVFCSGGLLAVGALFECQRRGIEVPRQLAIAGFSDSEMALEVTPPLTTLRLPRYKIGQLAATLILTRLAGQEPESKIIDTGFELVQRSST